MIFFHDIIPNHQPGDVLGVFRTLDGAVKVLRLGTRENSPSSYTYVFPIRGRYYMGVAPAIPEIDATPPRRTYCAKRSPELHGGVWWAEYEEVPE